MTEKDREQLLGYLLGALEPEEQAAVESRLADDAELRAEAASLRRGLAPLDEDLEGYEPPSGLAGRTCRLVAWTARRDASIRRRETGVDESIGGAAAWTFTDAAVAAGVLIALSLLFFPALVRGRYNAAVAACQNNLRQLGVGYEKYAMHNAGLFPSISPEAGIAFAGLSPMRLFDQGYLTDQAVLRCGTDDEVARRKHAILQSLQVRQPDGEVKRLALLWVRVPDGYAYNVGYRQGNKYQGCRKSNRCRQAIAGDAPRCIARGLPPQNHEGRGGNVLFADGRVEFVGVKGPLQGFYVSDAGLVEIPGSPLDDVIAGSAWQLHIRSLDARSAPTPVLD